MTEPISGTVVPSVSVEPRHPRACPCLGCGRDGCWASVTRPEPCHAQSGQGLPWPSARHPVARNCALVSAVAETGTWCPRLGQSRVTPSPGRVPPWPMAEAPCSGHFSGDFAGFSKIQIESFFMLDKKFLKCVGIILKNNLTNRKPFIHEKHIFSSINFINVLHPSSSSCRYVSSKFFTKNSYTVSGVHRF